MQGKGDAMWRALSVLSGDVICYLDADSELFGAHFAAGLLGPVALPGPVVFAKAFYRRPFRAGSIVQDTGGGRVTELMGRPLLETFFPDLAAVRQPWPAKSRCAVTSPNSFASRTATASTSPCSSTRGESSGSTDSPKSTSTPDRTRHRP